MIGGKFCSNCGMLVYPYTTFCEKCGTLVNDAPHANNVQTSPQPRESLGIRVEDFKSMKDYRIWLEKMGTRIEIVRVIPYTLPWLTECYIVTYELFTSETSSFTLAPSLEIQTGN